MSYCAFLFSNGAACFGDFAMNLLQVSFSNLFGNSNCRWSVHWGVVHQGPIMGILGQKKKKRWWKKENELVKKTKTNQRARKVKRWRQTERKWAILYRADSHLEPLCPLERFPHLTEVTAALKTNLWPHCKCHSHLGHTHTHTHIRVYRQYQDFWKKRDKWGRAFPKVLETWESKVFPSHASTNTSICWEFV